MIHLTKKPQDTLSQSVVHRMTYSCDLDYVAITKRSIGILRHKRSCQLDQLRYSAVDEYALLEDHRSLPNKFEETVALSNKSNNYASLYNELIEIHKRRNNCNKEDEGQQLNRVWYPVLILAYNEEPL